MRKIDVHCSPCMRDMMRNVLQGRELGHAIPQGFIRRTQAALLARGWLDVACRLTDAGAAILRREL
jgi:hypothetical protein